jgi:hypothetical protein
LLLANRIGDVNNYTTVPPGPEESNSFRPECEISALIHKGMNSVSKVNINQKTPC